MKDIYIKRTNTLLPFRLNIFGVFIIVIVNIQYLNVSILSYLQNIKLQV